MPYSLQLYVTINVCTCTLFANRWTSYFSFFYTLFSVAVDMQATACWNIPLTEA